MASLISTIGAENANSYLSVADADAYFANSLNAGGWTNLTNSEADADTKCKALISATRLLDSKYQFKGRKADDEQALAFPRYNVYSKNGGLYASDELPRSLRDATAELSLALLSNTEATFADPETAGIKRVSAGGVSVEFDKTDRPDTVPDKVLDLITHLISSGSGKSRIRTVRLVRT